MSRAWRGVRGGWVTLTGTGAAASVACGLLVFTAVLVSLVIPRESAGLRTGALQRVVAASPLSDRAVIGTMGLTSPLGPPGPSTAPGIAAVGRHLRSRVAATGLPVARGLPVWGGLTSGFEPVTGAARGAGRGQPQFEVIYRTALPSYSHLVAGRLPSAGAPVRGVVPTAVTTTTAARFGLRIGDRLAMGPVVRLVIAGIIRPVHAASSFWSADLVAGRPLLVPRTPAQPAHWAGALFIGGGALQLAVTDLNPNLMLLTWAVPADLGRVTADQASPLRTALGGLVSSGLVINGGTSPSPGSGTGQGGQLCPTSPCANSAPPPAAVTVETRIPAVLTPFITADAAVAPVLGLMYVGLAVMGAVVVLLGAGLVAQRRAAEFTLMRARGAALHQLGWLALRASAVIAVVAGAAAVALAVSLTPSDRTGVSWWLAGLTIAVAVAGPVLVSIFPQRVATPVTGRPRGRPTGRRLAARRIVTEVALTAAAAGGLAVLREQGLAAGNIALYPSTAPVLVAVPVAIAVLRCYPPAARGLARIAGRARGVVAFVGLARATRTPASAVLPAFALVLALAMVAFPAMISASVTRGQVAESWRQVGADAIIQAPGTQVIPPALQHEIAAMPGVVSTATGVIYPAVLPATGQELTAVFVSPAEYAAVTGRAPGTRFPLAAMSGSTHGATVPAVINAAAAPLLPPTARLSLGGSQSIGVRVAGRIGGVPGLGGDAVAVMPVSALRRLQPLPAPPGPGLMLVGGSGLNAARLHGDVSREMPGGSVSLRATALAAITAAPVPRAAQVALEQGMAAAAGFGALVLLLSLVLGARTRDMTLARLSTMGLRRWQAQLLLAAETLPQVVAAAIGGAACALLLAPLVGPSINLAAFTEAAPGVTVVPAPLPLAASVAGLVLVSLLALAVQAVITYRRGSARALRIAE